MAVTVVSDLGIYGFVVVFTGGGKGIPALVLRVEIRGVGTDRTGACPAGGKIEAEHSTEHSTDEEEERDAETEAEVEAEVGGLLIERRGRGGRVVLLLLLLLLSGL